METLQQLTDRIGAYGDRTGLVDLSSDMENVWTFPALRDESESLANRLLAEGLRPQDRVALIAPNSAAWVIAALAILRAGAVCIPIDTQATDEQLKHMLQLARPKKAFVSERLRKRLAAIDLEHAPETELLEGHLRGGQAEHPERDFPEVSADDTAVIFFTSGTTGPPKGVPLSHRNLMHQLEVLRDLRLVTETDRLLLPLPLHHVYPFTIGLLTPMYLGVPIIFPAGLTGAELMAALRDQEASFILGLPRLYSALYDGIQNRVAKLRWPLRPAVRGLASLSTWLRARFGVSAGRWLLRPLHGRFAPKLRTLVSGGAPLAPDLARRLEGFGWQVAAGYGLTETSPLLTLITPQSRNFDGAGKPVRGVTVRIRKTEDELGEVEVQGPNVFAGYLENPQETAKSFTKDGWFKTGDRGRLDESGVLHLFGRLSTLIITPSGEKIQPDPLEEHYERHPTIGEIGILQRDHKLVAVVVPEVEAAGEDVRAAISEALSAQARSLPSFQRLSGFEVSREPLARTRLGRIRRRKLQQRYDTLRAGQAEAETGSIPLENMREEDRALLEHEPARQVWRFLADRFPDVRLRPDSSFTHDLGVDSLGWVDLSLDIQHASGAELTEDDVAEIQTVRDLLRTVTRKTPKGVAAEPPDPLEYPEKVLSEAERVWLRPASVPTRWLGAIGYGLNRLIFRTFFELKVEGAESVPKDTPVILTPNHTSYMDGPALAAALDNDILSRLRWAGSRNILMSSRIRRFFSRAARIVPIDPGASARRDLAYGAATLKQGETLVWFPEGDISRTGKLKHFQPGAALLADKFQVPVVPVIIQGTSDALPPGHQIPKPKPVRVRFGQPLDPGAMADAGEEDRPWKRINRVLHDQMDDML
ncbi:AMP-binding protein [Dichotomicrobium thermohalophilum]|uniref:Long-chain acyl-CoA synthetase n=1 Tax=Dichotomicrobium thermohalophilum TaxID=933063 RepID=A0A397Q3L2_9HYPH|nr:AMP-binding protein [Dichotomicrobium thermohalophilum]RIA54989.1 long-chain acyl-CoA synthetase [Dichotomicrobium thermohalophilum]